jgi:hypothetical protein
MAAGEGKLRASGVVMHQWRSHASVGKEDVAAFSRNRETLKVGAK